MGPLGLNVVPNARMNDAGTVSFGASTLDPYLNAYIGLQIAEPLYVQARQSAEVSSLREDADRMYPGLDLKLRLARESGQWPEISLGLQSAIGHKRLAGEYLAASKRWDDFDFTLGMGWGRMAGKGLIDNPLKLLPHFDKDRSVDGEMPSGPSNWFAGEQIGFFGGVEYFTPINGLSLKADYGGPDFAAEKASFDYDAPALWSLSAVYRPFDFVDVGIAAMGLDKIMARLSMRFNASGWKTDYADEKAIRAPMSPYRTGLAEPLAMESAAAQEGINLQDARIEGKTARAAIDLNPFASAPRQYGAAARNIANHAGKDVEEIEIAPSAMNLRGPKIKMLRADFERALARKEGSADEIWRHAEFDGKSFGDKPSRGKFFAPWRQAELSFLLDGQASLSEEDTGLLYRTSGIIDLRAPTAYGAMTSGAALRVNLKDNLDKLDDIRFFNPYGARGDVSRFAGKRLTLENSWLGWTHSFTPAFHLELLGGYLEEMYAGYGGEILYRPFGPRWALGAEGWHVYKRDAESAAALGLNGANGFTGFLNAWYDAPVIETTFHLKGGQFLGGDRGFQLSMEKTFDNGVKFEGFAAISNAADYDPFGGTTHAYNGIRLSVPFYHTIKGQRMRAAGSGQIAPLGRDAAQTLNPPMTLYELTEPFSYRHVERHWGDVTN